MKRSEINAAHTDALRFIDECGWALPPDPLWDITDFGLGDFEHHGLVLVNLAQEPEYCEKIMVSRRDQITVAHYHKRKKEDIICRRGKLAVRICGDAGDGYSIQVNGDSRQVGVGEIVHLSSGERITLAPPVPHEFWPESDECLIGEVSTANDDVGDNFFLNPDVGRFPEIEEDEPAELRLISETDG